MLTPFGKEVRKIRIDQQISLTQMANDLGMKPSYLSAIENGRKPVPDKLVNEVHKYFRNCGNTKAKWRELADASTTQFKLDLKGVDERDRDLFLAFGRSAKYLPSDAKKRIREILRKYEHI